MRKKRISLLLVFAMLLSMLPVSVAAGGEGGDTPATPGASDTSVAKEYTVTLDTSVEDSVKTDVPKVAIHTNAKIDAYELTYDTDKTSVKIGAYANEDDTTPESYIYLIGPDADLYQPVIDGVAAKHDGTDKSETKEESTIWTCSFTYKFEKDTTITVAGKPLGEDGKYKSIVCDKDVVEGNTKDYNVYTITADTSDKVGEGGVTAYRFGKVPENDIAEIIKKWTQATTKEQVEKDLTVDNVAPVSVTSVDYTNNNDTLVVVKYVDNRVVKAGPKVIDIKAPATKPDESCTLSLTLGDHVTAKGENDSELGTDLTKGQKLTVKLSTDNTAYEIKDDSVVVTMVGGGSDFYSYDAENNTVTITSVTGNVTIKADAKETEAETVNFTLALTLGEHVKAKDANGIDLAAGKKQLSKSDTLTVQLTTDNAEVYEINDDTVKVTVNGETKTDAYYSETENTVKIPAADITGEVKITAEAKEKSTHTVTISGTDTVKVGEEITLTATVTPDDTPNTTYKWTVDATYLDIVGDVDGKEVKVKGKSAGTTDVTFTITAGGKELGTGKKTITVTSSEPTLTLKSLKANGVSAEISDTDKTATVTVETENETGTVGVKLADYEISPDVKKVVFKDEQGNVLENDTIQIEAGLKGKVTIMLIDGAGNEKTYTLTITVKVTGGGGGGVDTVTITADPTIIEADDPQVKITAAEAAFDPENGKVAGNWVYTGGSGLELTNVIIDGKTATLQFTGTWSTTSMSIYAKAAAFVASAGVKNPSKPVDLEVKPSTKDPKFTVTVKDADGNPVPKAQVVAKYTYGAFANKGETDDDGVCIIALKTSKSYVIEVSKDGYITSKDEDANKITVLGDPTKDTKDITLAEMQNRLEPEKSDTPVNGTNEYPANFLLPDDGNPVETEIIVKNETEAVITLDKANVDAISDSKVVSSTTIDVGDGTTLTLPPDTMADLTAGMDENLKLGIEVKKVASKPLEIDGQMITPKATVSVSLFLLREDNTVDQQIETDNLGLAGDKRFTITLNVGDLTDSTAGLLYVPDDSAPLKVENGWGISNRVMRAKVGHFSTYTVVEKSAVPNYENLETDIETVTFEGTVNVKGNENESENESENEPISGATVTLTAKKDGAVFTGTTGDNGKFQVRDMTDPEKPKGIPAGEYAVSIKAPGFEEFPAEGQPETTVTVSAADTKKYEYELTRGKYTLTVIVQEPDEETRVEDAVVVIEGKESEYTFIAKGNGVYSCDNVVSGEYVVRAETPKRDSNWTGSAPVTLTDDMDEDDATKITLKAPGKENQAEIRGTESKRVEFVFNGKPGVRYLVLMHETSLGEDIYKFNLYTGTVDTVINTTGQRIDADGTAEINIWKLLDANKRITYSDNDANVTAAEVEAWFGHIGEDGLFKKYVITTDHDQKWKDQAEADE